MKALMVAASLLILSGCKTVEDAGTWIETADAVTIRNNGGGNTQAFAAERARLERSGKPVRIEGYCASACTIFYSLPNACLAKGSSLHFHGSSSPLGIGDAIANATLARYYRAGILAGFLGGWNELTKPMHKVGAAHVVKLDPEAKLCEE